MTKILATLLLSLVLAMPVSGAGVSTYLKAQSTALSNSDALPGGAHPPFQWKTGGDALVEVFAETSFGGDFDSATVTMEYSSTGKGGEYRNVGEASLVGIVANVFLAKLEMAKGFWFRFRITGGLGGEKISISVGLSP